MVAVVGATVWEGGGGGGDRGQGATREATVT